MVEYGTYVKHLKVEVYLVELKLCIHPHLNEAKTRYFSRAALTSELTERGVVVVVFCPSLCLLLPCADHSLFAEDLQEEMLKVFELPADLECRLWQRYMTNSYELLNKPEQSLTDASVYGGQVSANSNPPPSHVVGVCVCVCNGIVCFAVDNVGKENARWQVASRSEVCLCVGVCLC